jgi:hypothetical protein
MLSFFVLHVTLGFQFNLWTQAQMVKIFSYNYKSDTGFVAVTGTAILFSIFVHPNPNLTCVIPLAHYVAPSYRDNKIVTQPHLLTTVSYRVPQITTEDTNLFCNYSCHSAGSHGC